MKITTLNSELQRIAEADHHDPFAVLGRHPDGKGVLVRAYLPGAAEVRIAEGDRLLKRVPNSDHFEWRGDGDDLPMHYSLVWRDSNRLV